MGILESIAFFIYNTAGILATITQLVGGFLFWIAILTIYPLSLFKRCRYACGIILFLISKFLYLHLWFVCVVASFHVVSWGVAMFGVVTLAGSVPIAVIGNLLRGDWMWLAGFFGAGFIAIFFHYTGSLIAAYSEDFRDSI